VTLKGWNVDRVMASLGWGGALTNHLPALAAEVHCRRPSTTESPTPMALDPEAALGDDARSGVFSGDGEGAPAPG
jgi:hypothetical protein